MVICIFNPEHDLCMANGGKHYMPPKSALDFAASSCNLMQVVYPTAVCCTALDVAPAFASMEDGTVLVPWGWNLTLKYSLLKQGLPSSLLPSDKQLAYLRNLQHRTTLLPLQPESCMVTSIDEVAPLLKQHGDLVLKAPWSGAGRGLRWVSGSLTPLDRSWLDKVVRTQRCAIAEPRWNVEADFALEYFVDSTGLHFGGYSLFDSSNGVYQGNYLLSDEAIAQIVAFPEGERAALEDWLQETIVPYYRGPLGIDIILDHDGLHHITELNLRHTMGWVAHEYLRSHPTAEGQRFSPLKIIV